MQGTRTPIAHGEIDSSLIQQAAALLRRRNKMCVLGLHSHASPLSRLAKH